MERLKHQKYQMIGTHGCIIQNNKIENSHNLKKYKWQKTICRTKRDNKFLSSLKIIKMQLKKNINLGKVNFALIFILLFSNNFI